MGGYPEIVNHLVQVQLWLDQPQLISKKQQIMEHKRRQMG